MKIDESKFRFRIGDKVMCQGEEHTIMAYYFSGGFNNYDNYGYVVDYPSHSGSDGSYNENGEPVTFPKNSVYWALENNVSPAPSVADRLRYAPKGMELYSIAHGTVNFNHVENRREDDIIIVVNKKSLTLYFFPDGKITSESDGEVILFPSKENRDWTTVDYSKPKRQDLPTDTVCIVTDSVYRTDSCFFRYYAYKSTCYDGGEKSDDDARIISWAHIIPVDKFDFKNLTFKPEDDYGTKSEYNG